MPAGTRQDLKATGDGPKTGTLINVKMPTAQLHTTSLPARPPSNGVRPVKTVSADQTEFKQTVVDRDGYVDKEGSTTRGGQRGIDRDGYVRTYVDRGAWREGIVSKVVTFVIQLPAPAAIMTAFVSLLSTNPGPPPLLINNPIILWYMKC